MRYDWAVLKLNKNIGNQCHWLNLVSGGNVGLEGPDYHLSGYPVHDIINSNYSEFQTDFLDSHYNIHAAEEARYFILNYAKRITQEIINTVASF